MGKKRGDRRRKKGISPLIASVLLIGFAITIGAVIMGWGQSLVEGNADTTRQSGEREIRCTIGTGLQTKVVGGVKKLCFRNTSATVGQIEFMLENNGDKTVEGVRIVIVGENDEVETADQNSFQIIGGGVKKGTQNFTFSTIGNVSQVDFIPKVYINSNSALQLCSNKRLTESNVFECS